MREKKYFFAHQFDSFYILIIRAFIYIHICEVADPILLVGSMVYTWYPSTLCARVNENYLTKVFFTAVECKQMT